MNGEFEVVGGSGGIEADYEDMEATGSSIRHLGWEVGEVVGRAHGVLLDGDLLASAVLSPGTFAAVEADLLAALDGPDGLVVNAARLTATGVVMQAAAHTYRAADEALVASADLRQHWQGQVFGAAFLASPAGTMLAAAGVLGADGAFTDPEGYLVAHPDLVERVIGSAPGTLDLLLPGVGYPANVEQAAALLGLLYEQRAGQPHLAEPYESPAPGNLAEAMRTLDLAADQEDHFRLERIGSGAQSAYNVYLPGTKAFDGPFEPGTPGVPDFLEESGLVQNMGTNLAGVGAAENAYVDSVYAALRDAGVPRDAPINLMGHSQGGIVAARLAERMSTGGHEDDYNVQAVVTAGSPVDHVDLPDDVHMVSLVNEYDIVPRLDGEAYEDTSNHTTIVTAQQTGSVTGNHSMSGLYREMSRHLVASEDPAVDAALEPLRDFFPGGTSRTWDVGMTRR